MRARSRMGFAARTWMHEAWLALCAPRSMECLGNMLDVAGSVDTQSACVYSIIELVSQVIMVLLVRTFLRGEGQHRFEVESPLHLVSVDHEHLPEHIVQAYNRF